MDFSVSVLWATWDISLVLLSLSHKATFLYPPPLTRHFLLPFPLNTIICQKCLMNHGRRKWDDHMIRLNSKHVANAIWQPYLDFVALVGFLSVCIRRCFHFFPHLILLCHTFFVFLCFIFSRLLSLYPPVSFLLFCVLSSFFLPSLFLPPIWLPSLHCHWQEVMPSLYCCKIENEDKLS